MAQSKDVASIREARLAMSREDYETAFNIYLSLAESGNVEAQAQIGAMYSGGFGVLASFDDAEEWLLQAANNGSAEAAHNLGTLYSIGSTEHCPDRKKAIEWYLRGRDLGANIAPSEWYDSMELEGN